VAPQAAIDLVKANNNDTSLYQTAYSASVTLQAPVVSMSFGANLEAHGAGSLEPGYDSSFFQAALNQNPHITFLESTGDN